MSIAIGVVIGLIVGGIAAFLFTSSNQRKIEHKLERTTKALEEAEADQKQQADQLRQLQQVSSNTQELEQSYQAKIQDIEQSYQAKLEALSQNQSRLAQLEQLEAQFQATEQSYQERLQETEQSYQGKIQNIEQSYQARILELQQAQASSETSAIHQAQLQDIEQSYQTQILELQQAHQQSISELEQAHQTQLQDIEQSYQARISELQQTHQQEIEALHTQMAVVRESSPETVDSEASEQPIIAEIAGVVGMAGMAGLVAHEEEAKAELIADEAPETFMARETSESDLEIEEFGFNPEEEKIIVPDSLENEIEDSATPVAIPSEDIINEPWEEPELPDFLGSESLLEEVSIEDSSSFEELPEVSEGDIENLSENFGDRPSDALFSDTPFEESFPNFSQTETDNLLPNLSETTANLSDGTLELSEMLHTEETSGTEVLLPEIEDEPISELSLEEDTGDFDFLEMLPTDDEITADLSEISASEEKDPFAPFLGSDLEEISNNTDDPLADLLTLGMDDDESQDDSFMNLLPTDEDNQSQPHESDDWGDLFEDEQPASNGKSEDKAHLEEILKSDSFS